MKIMTFRTDIAFLIGAIVFIQTTFVFAQKKTFVREFRYNASDMDSKISCRTIALSELRKLLLSEVGVYVESQQLLKTSDIQGKFNQDFSEQIITLSAGVTSIEVLEETWNGITFWMKAAITIDKNELEQSLKQLLKDREKVKELEDVQSKLKNANEQLLRLNSEVNKLHTEKEREEILKLYKSKIIILASADSTYYTVAKAVIKYFNNSIAELDAEIKLRPTSQAFIKRGEAKVNLGQYEEAILDFNSAIELNNKDDFAYVNRGAAKGQLGMSISALNDLDKGIELNPSFLGFYNRGVIKAQLGKKAEAIKDFDKAIELDSNDAVAYSVRGLSKYQLGLYEGALDDYDRAIRVDPTLTDAYTNRGLLLYKLKVYSNAISDLSKVIELSPFDGSAYFNRGIMKFDSGDKTGACVDWKKAKGLGHIQSHELISEYCK